MQLNNPHIPDNSISVIAAPTGSRLYPVGFGKPDFEHPHFKFKPGELAEQIQTFYENKLISQLHIHARNPETGGPTGDPEHYELLLDALKPVLPENSYLSITCTDNNMPEEDKVRFGFMARAAVLNANSLLKPDRVPLFDALSMVYSEFNSERPNTNLSDAIKLFKQESLGLMDKKNIGFEIEILNMNLISAAESILSDLTSGIQQGIYSSEAIKRSVESPVIQILLGARRNMPCNKETLTNVVDEVLHKFSPRAIQVAFRGEGHRYDPQIVDEILYLAKEKKVTGIRLGLEDDFKNPKGDFIDTKEIIELFSAQANEKGISINSPQVAKNILESPLKFVQIHSTLLTNSNQHQI